MNTKTKIASIISGAVAMTFSLAYANLVVDGNLTVEEIQEVSDGVVFYGTFGGASSIPDTGAGTRLMWYPKKAAFRAGHVTGNQWDDSQVGDYSAAFGYNSRASGEGAFAAGINAMAFGEGAFAAGVNTFAGPGSIAIGRNTSTYDSNSIALGDNNYMEEGFESIAIGNDNLIFQSGAGGSIYNCIALGFSNDTWGNATIAIGQDLISQAVGMVSIGQFNETFSGNPYQWHAAEPLFVIGNGTSSQNRSDAVVVYKNADAHMQGSVRIHPQGDISMGGFTNGTSPNQAPQ